VCSVYYVTFQTTSFDHKETFWTAGPLVPFPFLDCRDFAMNKPRSLFLTHNMLKAMHAFVSLHSAPAPSTAAGRATAHQQVFDELGLELAGMDMDEETDSCSPVQILLPSSTRHGKSKQQDEKGTLDDLPGHSDSTQACPRPGRLGPTAASISVPALVDDDFVVRHRLPLVASSRQANRQPVALGSLKCIGLCEVHPWAYVSVISLRSPVADTKPEHLKAPISSLYLALDAW
jgi:hypothetical protein